MCLRGIVDVGLLRAANFTIVTHFILIYALFFFRFSRGGCEYIFIFIYMCKEIERVTWVTLKVSEKQTMLGDGNDIVAFIHFSRLCASNRFRCDARTPCLSYLCSSKCRQCFCAIETSNFGRNRNWIFCWDHVLLNLLLANSKYVLGLFFKTNFHTMEIECIL